MFICNIKVSGSKIFKIFAISVSILIFILFCVGIYRIYSDAKSNVDCGYSLAKNNIDVIEAKNYTDILKAVHDNLDNYIGTKIKFSGYIYRTYDFTENQFVLARDMIISSDHQSLIVGFLCDSPDIKNFEDYSWIEVTGEITKGDYHGEIPIIKIMEVKEIEKPMDEYVYPPDNTYIPTNGLL